MAFIGIKLGLAYNGTIIYLIGLTMTLCPCASGLDYSSCCQQIHQSHAAAKKPEQLMRARYSAHVLGLVDFIVDTYHASCEAQKHQQAIIASTQSQWLKLQVISSETAVKDNQGYVEFKAFYLENNKKYCLHERSRFIQEKVNEQMLWFYIDGVYPEDNLVSKLGRNDPCHCGSGKKLKKCCG